MIPFPFAVSAVVLLILGVIWDAFESIILPRRWTRRFRFARLFYRITWTMWRFAACLIPSKKTRESLLGFYGPISLLVLVGVWAVGLIFGFGLLQFGAGSSVSVTGMQQGRYTSDLYLSGTPFFSLGMGDA